MATRTSDPTNSWNFHGSPLDPNPLYVKRSVADWAMSFGNAGGLSVFINGIHFEAPAGTDTELAYPLFRYLEGIPTYDLVNTGVAPVGGPLGNRACIAWGIAGPSALPVFGGPWTYSGNDWPGVYNHGTNYCGYFGEQMRHRVVGLDPLVQTIQDCAVYAEILGIELPFTIDCFQRQPRTYIGRSILPGGSPGDEVCILVGGWFTNQEANDAFEAFECEALVQLDGGASSQLTYWSGPFPTGGQWVHAVDGYNTLGGSYVNRPVPHVLTPFEVH